MTSAPKQNLAMKNQKLIIGFKSWQRPNHPVFYMIQLYLLCFSQMGTNRAANLCTSDAPQRHLPSKYLERVQLINWRMAVMWDFLLLAKHCRRGPLRNGQKNVELQQKNISYGENSYSLLTKVVHLGLEYIPQGPWTVAII
ncbi:uncharacterized protein FAM241A isoform X1 [Motacilla alba alba]|uniref:uncharacterized protein FAM241A isoform X1 n=1 Tax=Motacilla alba alba TaxID=1094192 RepID=UPI0018D52332|nr:uncharacterized protein FAM241A isoform X1 [Motacilla alba alba]